MDTIANFCNSITKISLLLVGLLFATGGDSYAEKEPGPYPAPLNIKGIYELRFSTFALGKMGIEIDQTSKNYGIVADIVSTGLMNILIKHSSHTTVDGSGSNFHYSRIAYESHYQTKKKKKYAQLTYKDGALSEEKVLPPDNRATRPAVISDLKNQSCDYLTLILKLRQMLYSTLAHQKTESSFLVYDGRRLTQVDAKVVEKTTIVYNVNRLPVIHVDLRRTLLAGFTKTELAEHDPNEGSLQVYFTDDERLLPIRLEAQLLIGTLSATLMKECRTGESCLLGIKE
jgi:hypothetical protein